MVSFWSVYWYQFRSGSKAYEAYKIKKKSSSEVNFEYTETKLSNKETHRQLLARSQYLLYKKRNDWSDNQAQRAKLLFKHYPDIEVAYDLICQFRAWYSVDHIICQDKDKTSKITALKLINHNLDQWMQQVSEADVSEIQNFKSLVERNRASIVNYFLTASTNALAEANNNIIQTFVRANRGTRNLDFFYFRLSQFLS